MADSEECAQAVSGPTRSNRYHLLRALRRPDIPAIPIGPQWLPQAAKDVTAFGSGTNLAIVTGILIGLLCLNRRFRATAFLLSSLGSGLLLCQSLKGFFARRRPTAVPHLVDFDPASFPSGHSMGAALVYLTLGSIISRQVSGSKAKTYFLSVALVLALIVGISRVYLGIHYPSDVLAGWAAGSLWSGLCAQVARWLQHQGSEFLGVVSSAPLQRLSHQISQCHRFNLDIGSRIEMVDPRLNYGDTIG